ncbi:MAG: 2-oxo acid dehydrogenase subunit E2 [Bacteroidetes bacterium]|nr:2-oxo acid dehydrogenase subunit E2 [Bacteroidota bacterium]
MAIDVLMPKMGESVQEGTILRWLKQPGDSVERDEVIAEISTDKVDTEIPSPAAGTLLEIVAQENETVAVGNVIARLGAEGEVPSGGASAPAAPSGAAPAASAPAEPAPQPVPAPQAAPAPQATPAPQAAPQAAPAPQASAPAPAASAPAGGERTEILMPKMGESVQEGTILRWLKKPGDAIERDEVIAEISTDKVDTEIPSPAAGTLLEIVAQENETVAVGHVIAYISSGSAPAGASAAASASAPAPAAPAPQPAPAASAPQPATPANGVVANGQAAPTPELEGVGVGSVPRSSGNRFYSPLVRAIATKEGIGVPELDAIAGSGNGGRVTKEDILGYVQNRGSRPAAAPAAPAKAAQVQQGYAAPSAPSAPKDYGADVEVVPMDRMRQLIAEHMVRSKHTSPHVTEVGEADVTGLVRLRELRKDEFFKREGIKLTFTPFFIAAIARALRDNPWVNASVDGTNVLVKKHVNVGVATALPDGNLIVPVIKDTDRLNITGIAHTVNDLATRARNKTLTPDEISGGTFTLTNYGVFGLLHGAPIINQPQVAILGSGAIQKRPVVREVLNQDMVVIRSMVYLSLSHDHRIIDGLLGGKFLSDVIKYLEGMDETMML